MPKGVAQQSLANAGTGQGISNAATGNANSLYSSLAPELSAEAAHPSGYTPTQMAAQTTAAQQSAGGSQASTVGQGALTAARTKNAGAGGAAIAQSQKTTGADLSSAAVNTQMKSADLAQHNQQAGLSGLESLYGSNLGTSVAGLNASTGALNTAQQADDNNPWMKILGSTLGAAGQMGSGWATGGFK